MRGLPVAIRHELVISGLIILAIALIGQRYGRAQRDSVHTSAAVRAGYPHELEPVADVSAAAFFYDHHERCFDQHYRLSWVWNRLDAAGYRACLDDAYAERLGRVLSLDGAYWDPTSVPPWARLTFTARLREGILPRNPSVHVERKCARSGVMPSTPIPPGDPAPDGEDASGSLVRTQPGIYRASLAERMEPKPCAIEVSIVYDRWPLGPPLETQIPGQSSFDVIVQEPQIIPIF